MVNVASESLPVDPGLLVVAAPERESLVVSGADAQAWLNGLITCDLSALDARRGAYGLLLTKVGKIETDLDVVVGDSVVVLSVASGTAERIRGTLDKYLVMEDAELTSSDLGFVRLIGPTAGDVADRLRESGAVAAGRIDWLGRGGAMVAVARAELGQCVARALELGGSDARQADVAAWTFERVRAGFPAFGVDYSRDDNPHEAGLERLAVSFSKGCYLGQEVVCMQDMRGRLKRRVVPLRVAGSAEVGADVLAVGHPDPVGRITSVAPLDAGIGALARLRAPFFEGGTALRVGVFAAEIVARDVRQ